MKAVMAALEHRRATGVGHYTNTWPVWDGLCREQCGDVEEFFKRNIVEDSQAKCATLRQHADVACGWP